MNGALKISMLISLTLHVAVFAVPGINSNFLSPSTKETKLIEVSLMKIAKREDFETEIPRGEVNPVRDPFLKGEPRKTFGLLRDNGVKEEPFLEEIASARDEMSKISKIKISSLRSESDYPDLLKCKADVTEELSPDFPQIGTSPQRMVDFQGYPPEAVQAVFKRYGMRYERYSARLGEGTTSDLVKAFTLDKEQLTGDGGSSSVTFSGRPKPGSMVLVIPPKVNLAILEAEREELRRRGLPLNTPLKKVVFGIGRDSHGHYAITVRELILRDSL